LYRNVGTDRGSVALTNKVEGAEMEQDCSEGNDKDNETKSCCFFDEDPCIWKTHEDSILTWDMAEHGDLLHDAQMRAPNITRKRIYRKMMSSINSPWSYYDG
jgi:hypothetical protein